MTLRSLFALLFLVALDITAAPVTFVGLVKDNHVFLADMKGNILLQIDEDPRPKVNLRWNKAAGWLSYMVEPHDGAAGALVVIDLSGKLVKEVSIRPVTKPPTIGMPFAEGVDWITGNTVRIWGGIDPSNCEMFDLNVLSSVESNWQLGKCGTFQPSPDGKHVAALGRVNHFTEEEHQFDTVVIDAQLDTQTLLYSGDGFNIIVLAGPVWSPDSKQIAVLERRVSSEESAVTILRLSGGITRTPLPPARPPSSSLEWVGQRVVLNKDVAVSAETGGLEPSSPETSKALLQTYQGRVAKDAQANLAGALAAKMHWSEAVVLR